MLILLHWNFNNWPLFFTQGEAEEQKSDTVEVGDNCHHSVTSLEHADSDSLQSVTSLEHVDSDSLPMTSPSKIQSRIYYSLIVFFNMSDLLVLLSPPELKLKLSLSDCLLSVACPTVCPSICLSLNFSHFHLLLQNHWANFNQS